MPCEPPPEEGGRWAEPRRLHPATLLFAALSTGRRFLVPAIAAFLSASTDAVDRGLAWALLVLGVPALLGALGKYFTFRYRLTGEELIVDSGVLSRQRRVIPLARLQNVEMEQSFVQRLVGVAQLRVETASGSGAEAAISVLGRADALELRRALLERRNVVAEPSPHEVETIPLARLSSRELVLAGATAGEAGLIIAGLLGVVVQLLEAAGRQLAELEVKARVVDPLVGAHGVVTVVAAAVSLLLVIGWILSIAGAVIGYHDLTLEKRDGKLRIRYGLLRRREGEVPLSRVQAIRVEESLPRRLLGLGSLKVESAGRARRREGGGAEAFLPLLRPTAVPALVRAVLGEAEYEGAELRPAHPRAALRARVRYTLPVILVWALLLPLVGRAAWAVLALLPFSWLAGGAYARQLAWALTPDLLIARAGFFRRTTWIVPRARIQTLHLHATPFQRRQGIATLLVDTASGGRRSVAHAVDLPREDAVALLETLAAGSV